MATNPRPLPALYTVYLLRSLPAPGATYIGSTPHPARRLAQHNGATPGGAARTRRAARRPWRMALCVAGFPSAVAALQFEWAFAHAGVTTFLDADAGGRGGPRTARRSVKGRIEDLAALLRSPGVRRWPLEVRFFCAECWALWRAVAAREGAGAAAVRAVKDFEESEDDAVGAKATKTPAELEALAQANAARVRRLDPSYAPLRPHLRAALARLEADGARCAVCRESIAPPGHMAVCCPHTTCDMAAHLSCLAHTFLRTDPTAATDAVALPTHGACPTCAAELRWADLVKEMTLRARGAKEVARLRKPPRKRRGAAGSQPAAVDEDEGSEEEVVEISAVDVVDAEEVDAARRAGDDDDASSVASLGAEAVGGAKEAPAFRVPRGCERIVQDSEADSDVEILG